MTNYFKFKVFEKEFPELTDICGHFWKDEGYEEWEKEIKVKRIDENVLNLVPLNDSDSWTIRIKRIYLIDNNGKVFEVPFGISVVEEIHRKKIKVNRIVVRNYIEDICSNPSEFVVKVIVYKPKVNIQRVIKNITKDTEKKVKAEIENI